MGQETLLHPEDMRQGTSWGWEGYSPWPGDKQSKGRRQGLTQCSGS